LIKPPVAGLWTSIESGAAEAPFVSVFLAAVPLSTTAPFAVWLVSQL
jgi:hypothetical protein